MVIDRDKERANDRAEAAKCSQQVTLVRGVQCPLCCPLEVPSKHKVRNRPPRWVALDPDGRRHPAPTSSCTEAQGPHVTLTVASDSPSGGTAPSLEVLSLKRVQWATGKPHPLLQGQFAKQSSIFGGWNFKQIHLALGGWHVLAFGPRCGVTLWLCQPWSLKMEASSSCCEQLVTSGPWGFLRAQIDHFKSGHVDCF